MRLNVTIYATMVPWQRRYLDYFIEGFRKHGITPRVSLTATVYPDTDVAVLFGPNYWKKLERLCTNFLQVNRKFIGDVNDNVAISWNGFNGRGEFCVDEVDPRRLRPHVFEIDPWHEEKDGYTLVLGQYDLGRNTKFMSGKEWHDFVVNNTGDEVFLRPWPGSGDMKAACRKARVAATLNSTAAIETVLLGTPTVTLDEGSPAWPICAHHLGHVHRSDNRLAWLEYLSNCQWNYKQIQNGDFWRQLWPRRGPRLCDVQF